MNLPKYNLSYNTRDLLKKLALNVSKRKIEIERKRKSIYCGVPLVKKVKRCTDC